MKNIVEYVKKLSEPHTLLYVTEYGSRLYGSYNENSDHDYIFIFLPNKDFLLTGQNIKHITKKSNKEGDKNTKEDFDITGWSLQYFTQLLAKGETNSIDVLYSYTNNNAVLYQDEKMKQVFDNHQKMYNIKNVKGFLGFANSQAKKYGIKGLRLKILKDLKNDKIINDINNSEKKLSEFSSYILNNYQNDHIKYIHDQRGKFIFVNGMLHNFEIKMSEFLYRINFEVLKYGERSKQAELSDGSDFKALSNAFRCYQEYIMLIKNGKIEFPFKYTDLEILINIKEGKYSSSKIKEIIKTKADYVDELIKNKKDNIKNNRDDKLIKEIILSFYKLKGECIMKQSLFDEDYRYNDDAQELDSITIDNIKNIFNEYVKKGYSPREIEYIMYSAIKDISLSHTLSFSQFIRGE